MFELHRLHLDLCSGKYVAASAIHYALFAFSLYRCLGINTNSVVELLAVSTIMASNLYPGLIAEA